MSDKVENAKDTVTTGPVDAKKTTRPSIATVPGAGSAADLLKQAVSAGRARDGRASAVVSPRGETRNTLRYAAIAACGLLVGTALGLAVAPRPNAVDALATMQGALDAGRSEATRLNADVERIAQALASLSAMTESIRGDAKSRETRLTERLSGLEQTVAKRFATMTETIEKTGREQTTQLVAQFDKRNAAAPASAPAAVPTPAVKTEPVVTGTITEAKPKSEVIGAWALRDVYAGVAILEDRKRRLIEVARGDVVPGIGRVETIERRGRAWVVVTRQGVITPQEW